MNEQYCECMVKRKVPGYSYVVVPIMITVCVLLWFMAIIGNFILMLVALAASAGVYFYYRSTRVEYEYVYVGGDLSFDRIQAQSRRKRMCTFDMDHTEIVAPLTSHAMDCFQNKQMTVKDFTSKMPDRRVYVMVCNQDGKMTKVLFEPNEKLLNMMRMAAPRKVNIY